MSTGPTRCMLDDGGADSMKGMSLPLIDQNARQFEEAVTRAYFYAHRLIGFSARGELAIDGLSAEDFVHTAVCKWFVGERKGMEMVATLISTIRSDIYHARQRQRFAHLDDAEAVVAVFARDPDHDLQNEDVRKQILELVQDDPEAASVVRCWMSGTFKAREVADELGLPVGEVYAIYRRLRRRARRALEAGS
ncbi:MAG: hypothetical protein CMJ83_20660 [Planctomycetes bacterium]|nr:hypothetical protein [Planctomycetota bacterium]